ncbi:hypothetical protein MMC06_004376 [Schaereria dolodes]|nr:hypothetical protein [Schaereria dolodes]
MVSAIYEENYNQNRHFQASSSQLEEPAMLELRHETPLNRQVNYEGEPRMLSGFADYTVWYNSPKKAKFATNLIIVEAKKLHSTDTCLGQLTAYMGLVHASRKDEQKQNSAIYGVATDGLTFRFCCIDNDDGWSRSRLMEWEIDDKDKIYSIFRTLIRIAALSAPSTSPIKNPQQREKVLASFGSSGSTHKFNYDLGALELEEEGDELEIVTWPESST